LHSFLTRAALYAVLHPQLKLKYFSQHGWAKEWIETAEEIVRDEFAKYDTSDKATPTMVGT
jgi:hypothetical protein